MTNAANSSFTGTTCAKGGRVFLPVAPKSNVRRRFGEPETPGRALSPHDVLQWLERLRADTTDGGVELSAVGIIGPGDPLADPAPTLETLRAVHAAHPDLALTLSTNGLCPQETPVAELAAELAAAGLSQVTLLVDAVDPAIVEKLFAWIRPGRRTLPLPEASRLLVDAQAQAIRAFREVGLLVKVHMTVFAGINEEHVTDVASIVAALGADLFSVVPFTPVESPALPTVAVGSAPCTPAKCSSCASSSGCDTKAEPLPPLAHEETEAPALPPLAPGRIIELRTAAARHIALVPEGDPCGQDITWVEHAGTSAVLNLQNPVLPKPATGRSNVAVASSDGLEVDLHLGQAIRFLIYGPREEDGLPSLIGTREAPEPTSGGQPDQANQRWNALADVLSDCFAILASSVGANPRAVLSQRGLTVMTTEADVPSAVDALFGGGKKNGKKRIKTN
jgi:nitrogen fixation protein NifB